MKITIIAGANRAQASSTRLAEYVGTKLKEMGCEVSIIDLYRIPLPLYSPDMDEDADANVHLMAQKVMQADGIILSTPEYHGGPSGVLKNALDFLDSVHFDGKIVLSISSAGGAVGVSSLQQLQVIVRNVHGINCPEWISIGGDQRRFTPEGEPESDKLKQRVQKTLSYFVHMIQAFRNE